MKRQRYLKKSALTEARRRFLGNPAAQRTAAAETIPTSEALGRITARAIFARLSSPSFHCSAMDGIAVCAEQTFGASEVQPVTLAADQYDPLDTGDPIPPGRSAVVMIEEVTELQDGAVQIAAAVTPWQHIRMVGEDVVASEMLLPSGHRIRAVDIAVLLACAVQQVSVRKPPCVAVIPTGDELVDAYALIEQLGELGRIIESNSYLIANLVTEWGGCAERFPVTPDDPEAIRQVLLRASDEYDIVTINAGSSAGRDDFVPGMIESLGDLVAHGVDIMPGKPVSLGILRGKPVIGIPGYPVSAYVVCEEFLRPLISQYLGTAEPRRQRIHATLGRRTPSRLGNQEYVRVRVGQVGNTTIALPMARGASLLNSVVRADGVLRVPAHIEGIEQGEQVEVELFGNAVEIPTRLLVIGSHDVLLDLLADELAQSQSGISLSSAHVGSLAGLTSLKRGETHLAGVHLLDEATGEYNVCYVNRLFPEGGIALIHLTYRQQGLLLPPDNPRQIDSLADLAREGVVFVNRQRGSGTRVLLDYLLKQEGIDRAQVTGYERELYTHLAVAAAVQSGAADVGLGIRAVAEALGLEFIPVAEEQYDLALRQETLAHPGVEVLLALLEKPSFRQRVDQLGGYDLRESGQRRL